MLSSEEQSWNNLIREINELIRYHGYHPFTDKLGHLYMMMRRSIPEYRDIGFTIGSGVNFSRGTVFRFETIQTIFKTLAELPLKKAEEAYEVLDRQTDTTPEHIWETLGNWLSEPYLDEPRYRVRIDITRPEKKVVYTPWYERIEEAWAASAILSISGASALELNNAAKLLNGPSFEGPLSPVFDDWDKPSKDLWYYPSTRWDSPHYRRMRFMPMVKPPEGKLSIPEDISKETLKKYFGLEWKFFEPMNTDLIPPGTVYAINPYLFQQYPVIPHDDEGIKKITKDIWKITNAGA